MTKLVSQRATENTGYPERVKPIRSVVKQAQHYPCTSRYVESTVWSQAYD